MIDKNIRETVQFLSYEEAAEQVRAEIERLLTTSPRPVREYTSHLAQSWGKMIRAHSLLSCAEDTEGRIHSNAVKFASAIEILHLATLVHDDIIDSAVTRRGFATLQHKFGKRNAVICGDYLLCLALQQAGSVPDKTDYLEMKFPEYMNRICFGELMQNQNNGNLNLSTYRYLKIIAGKTAALFELSAYAGAVVCKDACEEIRHYMRLGHYMGMIFQLTDDCIDFESPESLAKKPVQSDFEQGVITLPLIHAFKHQGHLRQQAADNRISRSNINQAVWETGGLSFTRTMARRYYNKAVALLDTFNATSEKKERLIKIFDKACKGLQNEAVS